MDFITHTILEQAVIGLEYEFYSNKNRKQVAKELNKLCRKEIVVSDKYHSNEEVGEGQWKIEPDFSGGMKMMELITEPMGYYEAIATMIKVLNWIKKNGWTDEKSAFQFSISFDKSLYVLRENLEGINKLKLILDFDESFIYERFPNRKNSKYARSIKQIFPVNKFVFNDSVMQINTENYRVPDTKYYGINFSKLVLGYLEIRYLGGRGYEKKTKEIIEIIQYTVEKIYKTLEFPGYTDLNVEMLRRILREHKKVVSSFSDPESFQLNYPNIMLFVDLRGDMEVLKTFWVHIREQLFNLIVKCGMRKGLVNYDADVGMYQLKDAIALKSFDLINMEVFDSKLGGNIDNCDLYRCVISNAHITNSNLYQGNTVVKSKIIDTPIHIYNDVQDCYIDNKKLLINGKIEGGIIRSGEIAPTANISPKTEVIDQLLAGEKGQKDGGKFGKAAPNNYGNTRIGIEKSVK
jgi:hypothetical protein